MTAPAPQPPLAEKAFQAATDAYLTTPGGWDRAVQRALAELLALLAREADVTERCPAIAPNGDPDALAERDRLLARFTTLLAPTPDRRGPTDNRPNPAPVVAEAVGASVLELIRHHVEQRRLAELPSAVPQVTLIALTPYIGVEQAEHLAANWLEVHAGA